MGEKMARELMLSVMVDTETRDRIERLRGFEPRSHFVDRMIQIGLDKIDPPNTEEE